MKTRYFSSTALALAVAFLTTPLIAAEKPVEGPIDAFRGEPKLDMQQVFGGERFPNVVVVTDGTVLATWGRTSLRVRRSEDGGETWGDPITVGRGIQAGGATVDETSGDVLVFVEEKHPPAPLTVYRSKDSGKTWNVQETTIRPDANGNIPSMCMNEHGITLRNGKHAGRLIRPARHYGKGNDRKYWPTHYTTAIYSDDGGKTWDTSKPFAETATGEACVVELSDGRLYYNSRSHWNKHKPPKKRRHAWSDDGGETWRGWQVVEILPDGPQNTTYGCMGGLTRLPIKGRDIVLYSNCDSPGGRHHGTVWVSFDGGRTWPLKRLVFEGAFAYSSLNVGRPGTKTEGLVYLFFEGGPKGGGTMARFNLSWLLKGEKTGDGELPDWIDVSAKAPAGPSDGNGFVSLFDGKTLDGWHTVPKESASDWTVRDGVIVGHGTINRPSYLVWKDEHLTDFELRLRYRLPGKGNTGVDIRKQPALTGRRSFQSYHADLGHVGIGPHILGAWDFHFAKRREYPCHRGTRLVIDEDGKAHAAPLPGAITLADIRPHQWNDVRIIARGQHFQFFINGKPASEFTDNAKRGRLDQGAIGLQIHDKGMRVEFKDVRLKRLPSAP